MIRYSLLLCFIFNLARSDVDFDQPDCYASRVAEGAQCNDPDLCVQLKAPGGNEVCDDAQRASELGYHRAVYTPDEFACRVDAFADKFCVGDPSSGLKMDMVLTTAQRNIMAYSPNVRASGTKFSKLWEKSGDYYKIPYTIANTASWTAKELDALQWVFTWYHMNSLIRFVKRTDERDYLKFTDGEEGCWSYVGRSMGVQPVNLGKNCKFMQIMVHEILHALGSVHEQQRADRDDHIIVRFENIMESSVEQFDKAPTLKTSPYDFLSVMHYGSTAFAKDAKSPTMATRDASKLRYIDMDPISPSACDFYALNQAYGNYKTEGGCKPNVFIDVCDPTPACASSEIKDCQTMCRERCHWGIYFDLCQLKWTVDELASMLKNRKSLALEIYDPFPEEKTHSNVTLTTTPPTTIGSNASPNNVSFRAFVIASFVCVTYCLLW